MPWMPASCSFRWSAFFRPPIAASAALWRRSNVTSSATASCSGITPALGNRRLAAGRGRFLAGSFWLADNYILQNRLDEARELFERLLRLRNDVGLLAEEYDPADARQLGNFPQAFSHLALINTARNLAGGGPVHQRSAAAVTAADVSANP